MGLDDVGGQLGNLTPGYHGHTALVCIIERPRRVCCRSSEWRRAVPFLARVSRKRGIKEECRYRCRRLETNRRSPAHPPVDTGEARRPACCSCCSPEAFQLSHLHFLPRATPLARCELDARSLRAMCVFMTSGVRLSSGTALPLLPLASLPLAKSSGAVCSQCLRSAGLTPRSRRDRSSIRRDDMCVSPEWHRAEEGAVNREETRTPPGLVEICLHDRCFRKYKKHYSPR
mmetsp:Transcript_6300/g.14543  ORF Transcript_6300/g.14543 Transcript_6300/m.14543 type:complete len:230 (+) Transcript_6300:178-867(+)